MGRDLIIDDEYVSAVGDACNQRGIQLEEIFEQYVTILKEIQAEALVEGDVSEALAAFIAYAESVKGGIGEVSESISKRCTSYIQDVNNADRYLF